MTTERTWTVVTPSHPAARNRPASITVSHKIVSLNGAARTMLANGAAVSRVRFLHSEDEQAHYLAVVPTADTANGSYRFGIEGQSGSPTIHRHTGILGRSDTVEQTTIDGVRALVGTFKKERTA